MDEVSESTEGSAARAGVASDDAPTTTTALTANKRRRNPRRVDPGIRNSPMVQETTMTATLPRPEDALVFGSVERAHRIRTPGRLRNTIDCQLTVFFSF